MSESGVGREQSTAQAEADYAWAIVNAPGDDEENGKALREHRDRYGVEVHESLLAAIEGAALRPDSWMAGSPELVAARLDRLRAIVAQQDAMAGLDAARKAAEAVILQPGEQRASAASPEDKSAVPANWYYAQGDPPGTTRYWDGYQWIGDPVQQPGAIPPP